MRIEYNRAIFIATDAEQSGILQGKYKIKNFIT